METKNAMMVVSTKVNPGKQAAYNTWYDEHISLLFGFKGMKRVSRNLCTLPLGDNGGNSPEYITIYELEKKADIEGFFQSSQMQQAKKQFDERWDGLGDVLWSGWYEPVKTLERGPLVANKRYMEIVGSGSKTGQDAAYLDYYVDHFTKMFEYNGIKRVNYVRCFQRLAQNGKSPEYITFYDFESKEAREAFYQHHIFTGARKAWEEIGQLAMDLQWAACYDSVKVLER
jgi:hypothetical protein